MASFIEFPIFTGVSGDLRPWISWLENFFVREKFTADEKLNLAQSLLEGEAEVWFYRNQKMLPFQSWEDLKANLWLMFGDFADLDRIRRNPVNRCRKTTSLHTIESFSATEPSEKAVCSSAKDESITQTQVAAISGEKKELKKEVDLSLEKIASPLTLPNTKVHVSDSENLRNIETVVKEAKIQKNIRMDVINGDVEGIQHVMSITTNVSAHQVLDKLCQLKGLETKKKMKVLKSWMFKYKSKRRRSRKRHNQDWFNTMSRRESWRKHKHENLRIVSGLLGFNVVSFRCHKEYGLARMNNWSQVRAEYSLLQGKLFVHNDFTSDGILDGDIVAVCDLQNNPQRFADGEIYVQLQESVRGCDVFLVQPTCPPANENLMELLVMIDACRRASAKTITAVIPYFCYARADRMTHGCEYIAAYLEWHRWTHNTAYLQGLLAFVVFTLVKFYSTVTAVTSISQSMGLAQHGGEEILWMLLFWSTSFKKPRFGKNWWYKFKQNLWQGECGNELLAVEVVVAEIVVNVRFDDVGRSALLIKWQDHDASESLRMFFKAFVHFYHSFKLEDKLGLEGVSIDTSHQSHSGRRRKS